MTNYLFERTLRMFPNGEFLSNTEFKESLMGWQRHSLSEKALSKDHLLYSYLEITSLIETCLVSGSLVRRILDKGTSWRPSGTPQSLNDAANFVRILEERSRQEAGCAEEIELLSGWVNAEDDAAIADSFNGIDY